MPVAQMHCFVLTFLATMYELRSDVFLRRIADQYSAETGISFEDKKQIDLKTASILTHKRWRSENTIIKSLKTSHHPSPYILIDKASTAATRANLRSGHRLKEWRFTKHKAADNICLCCLSSVESVKHIVNECKTHAVIRHATSTRF